MTKNKPKARTAILLSLMAIYLAVLFALTVFRGSLAGSRSVNFIPFATILEYVGSIFGGNRITGLANLLGNLALFFPFGYIGALLAPKMRRATRVLASSLALSLFIEALQYLLACGAADIDDVILNVLGGLLGYWIYRLVSRFEWTRKCAVLVGVAMIAVACTGFFVLNGAGGPPRQGAPGPAPAAAWGG